MGSEKIFGSSRQWRFLIYSGAVLLIAGSAIVAISYIFRDPGLRQRLADNTAQIILAIGWTIGLIGLSFLGAAFILRRRIDALFEYRTKAVLVAMGDAIHIIDRHYRLLFTNTALER